MIYLLMLACEPQPQDSSDSEPEVPESPVDSEDSGDLPEECADPVVTFVGTDGAETDLTEAMLSGAYTTLDTPGTLRVCPGTWFARLVVRSDVHVLGLGAAPEDTVLSAGEQGTILDFIGEGLLMTVQNVTLDRGAGLNVEHNSGGGGIYCSAGSILVEDVVLSNCVANDGPGVYLIDACTADLQRVVFRDNVAEDDGGALTLWASEARLSEVVFENNEALDGGALAAFYSTLTLSEVDFLGNTGHNFGAGIWSQYTAVQATDVRFEGNVNDGSNGGAWLFDGVDGALERVDFIDNTGVVDGGLFLYWDSSLSCSDCDFSGNAPNDVWVADYSEEHGHSFEVGEAASFSCAANECASD